MSVCFICELNFPNILSTYDYECVFLDMKTVLFIPSFLDVLQDYFSYHIIFTEILFDSGGRRGPLTTFMKTFAHIHFSTYQVFF